MKPFDQFTIALLYDKNITEADRILMHHPNLLLETARGGYGTQGTYLLESASTKGDLQAMDYLFLHGVDLNATLCPNLFDAPIVSAAMNGHATAVKWLLDHGANPNQTNEGYTYSRALASASLWGHLECVMLLVEHGAYINEGWDGKNALWFAEQYGRNEIAQYLRSKGAKSPEELEKEAKKPAKPKPKRKK